MKCLPMSEEFGNLGNWVRRTEAALYDGRRMSDDEIYVAHLKRVQLPLPRIAWLSACVSYRVSSASASFVSGIPTGHLLGRVSGRLSDLLQADSPSA